MNVVKLPIILQNNRQSEMGIENPDKAPAYGVFVISQIEAILQTHDDSLGDDQVNTEGVHLQLKSGAYFYIPMFITDVFDAINKAVDSKEEPVVRLVPRDRGYKAYEIPVPENNSL